MIEFLRDLFGRPGARTVLLMDQDSMSTPRQYEVRPGHAIYGLVIAVVLIAGLFIALLVLTPLRGLVFGPGAEDLRAMAEDNARRASALEDSLSLQDEQINLLRGLIVGESDPRDAMGLAPALDSSELAGPAPEFARPARIPDVVDPPPLAVGSPSFSAPALGPGAQAYIGQLRLPALPPLDGILSRGFDAPGGHFAIDISATMGTPVRSVGEGFVVFADWTHDGGYAIAVQHPDGYLSFYKHNSRLLKRVGERVSAREVLSLSGNTGQITSGPHLHFELWRDGLAVNPATYLLLR